MPLVLFDSPFCNHSAFIWKIDEQIEELLPLALLSESEELKFLSFKNDRRKREWLAVRAGLNSHFNNKNEVQYLASGKPFLDSNKQISITHSGDYVAAKCGDSKVGIDLEAISERVARVCHKFLNSSELNIAKDDKYVLTIFWCVKEAVFKYCGHEGVDFANDINIVNLDLENCLVEVDSQFESNRIVLQFITIDDKYILAWVI